jgi:putative transposase
MSRRRFNKNEIRQILEKYEQGTSIHDLIEAYQISQATFYNWKAKYGQGKANKSEEIKKLIEDNERLKRMFAEISLENMKLKTQLNQLNEK